MNEEDKLLINSYLTFRLGKELFAANVKYIIHILPMLDVTKVPNAPDYMLGVINHRGKVLPVIDSRLKFKMEDTRITPSSCIVVVEVEKADEKIQIGALVDSVNNVLRISDNDIQAAPNIGTKYKSNFIEGIINNNGEFIILLNINNVFSNEDVIDINGKTDIELK